MIKPSDIPTKPTLDAVRMTALEAQFDEAIRGAGQTGIWPALVQNSRDQASEAEVEATAEHYRAERWIVVTGKAAAAEPACAGDSFRRFIAGATRGAPCGRARHPSRRSKTMDTRHLPHPFRKRLKRAQRKLAIAKAHATRSGGPPFGASIIALRDMRKAIIAGNLAYRGRLAVRT